MSEIALDQAALPGPDLGMDLNRTQTSNNLPASNGLGSGSNLPASNEQSAVVRFFEQPAVRQAAPAVIGLVVILFCIFFYMWISAPGYRSVYPGMIESDRQAAFDLLKSTGFDVLIDTSTGELQVTNDR